MSDEALEVLLEALIFASPEPVPAQHLADAVGRTEEEIEVALTNLETQLTRRGLRLQRSRDRLQLVAMPEAAPYIEELLGLDVTLRLTQAAMETLAIIAYAQPVTRPQVESIRGVSSDSTLRTLLSMGLIEETGRAETLGRPILYGTTFEFLQQFGLSRPDELPPLRASSPERGATNGTPSAEGFSGEEKAAANAQQSAAPGQSADLGQSVAPG